MALTPELEALLTTAAFAPIQTTGWIRVTGTDRVRWLNGMVTNSIQALQPGRGCYNFFLNAQGRIQGDCTAWLQPDSILLQTAAGRVESLIAYLDRFIIMDDVELAPATLGFGLLLAGPQAPQALAAAGFHPSASQLAMTSREDTGDILIRAADTLFPRFEIWSGSPEDLRGLTSTLRANGLSEASFETLEQLRLLEAIPLYGTDIRDKELPQETAQTRALHFAKGCYLGQEIVERIRSRGQVNRLFTPLTLTGELPAPGTVITANDKPAGEMTSAANVPGRGLLALGYLRREAIDTRAALTYPGGTATVRAIS